MKSQPSFIFSRQSAAHHARYSHPSSKLDEEWNGAVNVGKLNIYPNMPVTLKYNVMTAPVLMLFVKGEPVIRLQGYYPCEKLLLGFAPSISGHQN